MGLAAFNRARREKAKKNIDLVAPTDDKPELNQVEDKPKQGRKKQEEETEE